MKFYFSLLFLLCFAFQLNAQQTQVDAVDFLEANAFIELLPQEKKVKGEIEYTFQILKATDSVFLDAKNMKAELINASFKRASLKTTPAYFILKGKFKADQSYSVSISFEAEPKQALYFLGFDFAKEYHQIWTQGQGKYTSHWLPSIDDMNDKIVFNLTIKAPDYLNLIANGKKVNATRNASTKVWEYKMQKPMSSYLVALAAGNYHYKKEFTSTGIPIYNYYEIADSILVEPTYRYTNFIFNFFEEEIGIAYPWQNYKQVPVRDFLYSGMENTSLTIFSNQFMVDSLGFEDFNYINVNAHELAHQWFGNLVTETEAKHHWLHEGFATYYALLAEKQLFGDDYFYNKLYNSAEHLKAESDKGKGEAILNPKASSLTFYQKGAWALHILKEKIGEDAFRLAVKNYLKKYAFQNVRTDDFLNEIEAVSIIDIHTFKRNWLLQTAFQAEEALTTLKKSPFIQELLSIIALREEAIDVKLPIFQRKINQLPNRYIVEEIALQLSAHIENPDAETLVKQLIDSDFVLAQQALIAEIRAIPQKFQKEFETLLVQTQSYTLLENLLLKMWLSFPEKRSDYLENTKEIYGFKDQNIDLLWRFLSMVTPEHRPEMAMQYFNEFNLFTSSKYNFQIRENSFNYLYQVDRFNDEAYLNLIDACLHQPWTFRKFARELLKQLLIDDDHKNQIERLSNTLSNEKQELIKEFMHQ